jgi:hypothetical protein
MDDYLKLIKDYDSKEITIGESSCHMCCHSFDTPGLTEGIIYNS